MDVDIRSPWLYQLNRKRPAIPLQDDVETDIAIIGGGIAGISTAWFLLRDTDKKIALIEGDRIGHGATGHNGGQLVASFEQSLTRMTSRWGLEMSARAWSDIEGAWNLLEQVRAEGTLETPIWRFTGFVGLSDKTQVLQALEDNRLRQQAGMKVLQLMLGEEHREEFNIPSEYEPYFVWQPQQYILHLLETKDAHYVAAYAEDRGCTNSALLCEELALVMMRKYPDRFALYEMTPINNIELGNESALIAGDKHSVKANRVILCTNGFENLTIMNGADTALDTAFHHSIEGKIGYMAAFTEPQDHNPEANYYYHQPGIDPENPYLYITRRPYDIEAQSTSQKNLLSIGGPESVLLEREKYTRDRPYTQEIRKLMDDFLLRTYAYYEPGRTEDAFFWHGLMGYTTTRMRLVGPEPRNPILIYNLGCNGIGLLHSIFGGWKIAQQLNGKKFEPSVFDPLDSAGIPSR